MFSYHCLMLVLIVCHAPKQALFRFCIVLHGSHLMEGGKEKRGKRNQCRATTMVMHNPPKNGSLPPNVCRLEFMVLSDNLMGWCGSPFHVQMACWMGGWVDESTNQKIALVFQRRAIVAFLRSRFCASPRIGHVIFCPLIITYISLSYLA